MTSIDAESARSLPILYSFRRCPYAIRARMALKYSGIAVHLREIVLRNKPPSMLAYSAKGTVPVLVLSDDRVIDESRDVMSWALAINDPKAWLPAAKSQDINALLDANDFEFKAYLDRYKYADRFPEQTPDYYRAQGELFLQDLETRLSRHRYLTGDAVSMADVGIFPFIRQFANVDKQWFEQSPYPQLQRWLAGFLGSDDFNSVMDKYAPWVESDAPLVFG